MRAVKYDEQTHSLSFNSAKEVEAFHAEVTDLIRLSMVVAHEGVADPQVARDRAQEVMKRFATVMRALNALRKSLPRSASGP